MNIYILRHGIAVERGTPDYHKDSDRPLTPKGRRKLRRIASAMKALDLQFDLILTSPYARALQTAESIAAALKSQEQLKLSASLEPAGQPNELIDSINLSDPPVENVLLVGHEPDLSSLISLLVTGNSNAPITMKKGGLCKLSAIELRYGQCASLEWLLTPKQMELMA